MPGQINRGSLAGEFIYHLSCIPENKVFVDIGTWNGQGSTKCIVDGLIERDDECVLYSLEADIEYHDLAKKYYEPVSDSDFKDRLKLIHGRILEVNEMPSIEELKKSRHWIDEMLEWYARDLRIYEFSPNVIDIIPDKIDVLILDGGEFITESEYRKLKDRTRILFCDDSSVYKCERVREELLNDDNYSVLIDMPRDRQGFCAFERKS